MTTVAQLPPVATVGSGDLLPLSQAGLLYAVSVSQLTANLQPVISVPTGELLGRQSIGAGEPEALVVGTGLVLSAGTLQANGTDHAGYPLQGRFSLTDEMVINSGNVPALLPVTALRGIFTAGTGIGIDANGVITVTVSAIAGPVGPQGATGPAGPAGSVGPAGPSGDGLLAPAAGNSASSIGATDYVAIWQNGATAWMPYGQFLGGQTIDQLPAAGPAGDSDELLVAQGSNSLSVQSFGAIWTYLQSKLPSFQLGVVELTTNAVLDSTNHNNRILVASQALTLTANFSNTGAGFSCTLVNLAAGSVSMGTGISSGSGSTVLPPGASTTLLGLAYSGGSLIWWSGITQNAPTLTVATISAPAPGSPISISGGIFNDAPIALDYSTNGGTSWTAASSPVISSNAYNFTIPGLVAGTYTVRVRDHADPAVVGISNGFSIAPPSIEINAPPAVCTLDVPLGVTGQVSPGNAAVRAGLSSTATTAPPVWVSATVSDGAWTATLTPAATGTYYVWAEQSSANSVQAVSEAITAVAAGLSISGPVTGNANTALNVTGTVSPAGDVVKIQLTTQNTTLPTNGWTVATNTNGNISGTLTPGAAGTYYVWAEDTSSGLNAVSAAIAVSAQPSVTYGFNNPGGNYTHGSGTIPLNGSITPDDSTPLQVALSISGTTVPSSGWATVTLLQSNSFWAIYAATPATAGAYYVWIETTAGGNPTVSSFTLTVT